MPKWGVLDANLPREFIEPKITLLLPFSMAANTVFLQKGLQIFFK